MLKYLHILFLSLLIAACSSEDYVGEVLPTEHPIAFGSNAGMVTRAGGVGLETYLPDAKKNLLLYGVKNTNPSTSALWQDVFQNYVLSWRSNTAGTTASNSSDWEYVGGTSLGAAPDYTPVTQTIKYWDYSADPYVFFAVAPQTDNTPVKVDTEHTTFTYITPTIKASEFAAKPFYFTGHTAVGKANYPKTVLLPFRSMTSKVRVGVYETIPGYAITDIRFYLSDWHTGSADIVAPILFSTKSYFYDQGTYTITSNYDTSNTDIVFEGSGASQSLLVGNTGVENKIPSKPTMLGTGVEVPALGTTSAEASFGKTNLANGYIYVMSDEKRSHDLAIKCDYTLKSLSAGSNDVIHITGRTAYVPQQYGTWRPNYAYTYLFKITDDGSGLYPISFDACVDTWADNGDDGTVTIVQKPSITTWQYQAVHDGDVNNPNKDVEYKPADDKADATHDVDVEVSTIGLEYFKDAQRLEVCYFGPQITEGEFEYYDKKARATSEPDDDFIWAPISTPKGQTITPETFKFRRYIGSTPIPTVEDIEALMTCNERADISAGQEPHGTHTYNDGTLLFGTFRPLIGGYYAIRFTYQDTDPVTLSPVQRYAYKIVKIGEYHFQQNTITINDDYQHGIVIE